MLVFFLKYTPDKGLIMYSVCLLYCPCMLAMATVLKSCRAILKVHCINGIHCGDSFYCWQTRHVDCVWHFVHSALVIGGICEGWVGGACLLGQFHPVRLYILPAYSLGRFSVDFHWQNWN